MPKGYPVMDIQRHVDELNGNGPPKRCAHCVEQFEGDGDYCEFCAPFYMDPEELDPDNLPNYWEGRRPAYKRMVKFKQEYSSRLWEITAGRFCLMCMAVDPREEGQSTLWLIDAQTADIVERWTDRPALDEVVAAALGDCTCLSEWNACPACAALARMMSDELPF